MPRIRFKSDCSYAIIKLTLAFFVYFFSVSNLLAAKVSASHIATIPPQEQRNLWHRAIASPLDNYHYYIARATGEIYLADARRSESSLLLNTAEFSNKDSFIELTAFTLHPSFRHPEQTGFLTFYTAHVEHHAPELNKKRLPKVQESSLVKDLVLNEWQVSKENYQEASLVKEIMRVSSPYKENKITKLAFNPYVKSWQDDFSFLYIAINKSIEDKTQAIYSGSILRINTRKLGFKPYIVPQDNPFINKNNIDNEIAILPADNIENIAWSKSDSKDLFITTLDTQQLSVFRTNYGDDWRKDKPVPLHTTVHHNTAGHGMFYFGKNLNWLWQHYFELIKVQNNWRMTATSGLLSKVSSDINSLVWHVDDQQLSLEAELTLFPDNQGEPLAFSPVSGHLYRLFVIDEQAQITQLNDSKQIRQPPDISIITIAFVLLLSTPMIYLMFHRMRHNRQSIRHQFTRLEFSNKTEQIRIYRPRQDKPSIELTVTEIIECSVYLNDIDLATVNVAKAFDNDVQASIEDALAREYRHKMVDDKIRKIEVSIKTKTNKEHIVCLYLRKGNTRITKNSYDDSLLFLFNWCWFISQKLHPNAKITRKLKLPVEPVTPVTKKPSPAPKAEPAANESLPSSETVVQQPTIVKHTLKSANEKTSIDQDTELVKALEKLVKFKEQGILSEAEFNQAKAKLLKDLVQN